MSADALRAAIEARLDGHTNRRDEAAILELLTNADAAALEGALGAMDLARLIGDLDDRRFGPRNREALLRLMLEDRLDEQSIPLRARWIDALSRGRTDDLDERGLAAVFLGTRGEALTALKREVDRGEDHRHLMHVVYSDIDDEGRRAAVLHHLAAEAAARPVAGLKVLSDIDDTFYANWVDERFPKKTVYPGVRAFYEALSTGGEVVFVTARPEDRPGLVEASTQKSLRGRGVREPVILAGAFRRLHSHGAIAEAKLANFERYAALFGEYELMFVGDSGQGDAEFGAQMIERAPDRVRAVLIHDVVGSPPDVRAGWEARGVRFFDTYVGAARSLERMGLLARAAVSAVHAAARAELGAIAFASEVLGQARLAELLRDADGLDAG